MKSHHCKSNYGQKPIYQIKKKAAINQILSKYVCKGTIEGFCNSDSGETPM